MQYILFSQSTDFCGLHIALQTQTLTLWSGINIFKSSFITTQALFSSLWLKFPTSSLCVI